MENISEKLAEAIVYEKFSEWVRGYFENPDKEAIKEEQEAFYEIAGTKDNFLFSLYLAFANGFNAGIELCNSIEETEVHDGQEVRK